jgi:hypothetical protein
MKYAFIGENKGWVYLDKMTFAPGTVDFQMRTETYGIPFGPGGKVTI